MIIIPYTMCIYIYVYIDIRDENHRIGSIGSLFERGLNGMIDRFSKLLVNGGFLSHPNFDDFSIETYGDFGYPHMTSRKLMAAHCAMLRVL